MAETKPLEELYDLEKDPHEISNLASSPAHKDVLERLRAAQAKWMVQTRDTGLLPEPDMRERASKLPSEYAILRQPGGEKLMNRLLEVAALAGKIQPSTLGAYADEVGCFYNHAPLAVERNNHGHAVLLWLEEHSELKRLTGYDDKPGWLNNARGKALMYSECADAFREGAQEGTKLVHSMLTYLQLASIEGSTLQAPDGEHDDRATAYALGVVGCAFAGRHWFDIGFA